MFKDREDAAHQLAKRLQRFKGRDAVIVSIPRGGVPLGAIIAEELGLPLEIILSKKIGHPDNPELAIGSVTLHGAMIDNQNLEVDLDYIKRTADRILNDLKERYRLFQGDHLPVSFRDKTIILIDDGLATGNTMIASIQAIRKDKPKEIIVAVPVSPLHTVHKLKEFADELICLFATDEFIAVGPFYENFTQVSDEEVIQLLKKSHDKVQS